VALASGIACIADRLYRAVGLRASTMITTSAAVVVDCPMCAHVTRIARDRTIHPILDMLDALSVADAGPCCSRHGRADLNGDVDVYDL
jgi:hypothetical protein